uniref:Ubiquitin-like domain-containing protein n=1 Tax=Callorhinchus milii TaxID=7868 RepID=A0A4W3I7S9_CALMI
MIIAPYHVVKTSQSASQNILQSDQVLLLAGTHLEDDAVIGQCGLSEHCTLKVVGSALGGEESEE